MKIKEIVERKKEHRIRYTTSVWTENLFTGEIKYWGVWANVQYKTEEDFWSWVIETIKTEFPPYTTLDIDCGPISRVKEYW